MSGEAPSKIFIDTNILIHAHDVDQARKHTIAQKILTDLLRSRMAVVSPQVLQEFYVNVTRKIAKPLNKRAARAIVDDFSVCCTNTTSTDVSAAFRIEDESKISFWDALICASALKSGAQVILSEDLNAGQMIDGMRIENPFV
jgi:predicted nucleic acid-binding protein